MILKSTVRRSKQSTGNDRSSNVQSAIILTGISLGDTSIVIKKLYCSCTNVTGMVIVYNVQSIPKAWIAIALTTRMGRFPKTISPHPMFIHTRNVFEIFSRNEYSFAS